MNPSKMFICFSILVQLFLISDSTGFDQKQDQHSTDDVVVKFTGVRASLFPNVPPYYKFVLYNESVETWPPEVRKYLKWRRTVNSWIIKTTLKSSGFKLAKSKWNFPWGKLYSHPLKSYQKINAKPGQNELDNKARLWRHLQRSIVAHGKDVYDFVPQTYVLPKERKLFKKIWDASQCDNKSCLWIAKPPGMANGWGIHLVTNWSQVIAHKQQVHVVQEYIKPALVNNRKFDLRLYVFLTSFRPLRAYFFKEGFVRFAATEYKSGNADESTMHLTNRWINKRNIEYVKGDDLKATKGHQWSVQAFWKYMENRGIDVSPIKEKIVDVIIKTLISVEPSFARRASDVPNRYNSYQIYGFDIGFDYSMKPWLFEVNRGPGMQTDSGFLRDLKGHLVTEYLNIAGYHFPPTMSEPAQEILMERLGDNVTLERVTFDHKLYRNGINHVALRKQKRFASWQRPEYLDTILTNLTGDDLRHLVTAEDELTQCTGFYRIFPSSRSHVYLKYFDKPHYHNQLLDAWEHKYGENRAGGINRLRHACLAKFHLIK